MRSSLRPWRLRGSTVRAPLRLPQEIFFASFASSRFNRSGAAASSFAPDLLPRRRKEREENGLKGILRGVSVEGYRKGVPRVPLRSLLRVLRVLAVQLPGTRGRCLDYR